MRGLPIFVIIASIVVTIYLIAVAVYLRNIKSMVTSTTAQNVLFWSSIVLIAIFVGLIAYSIYDMLEQEHGKSSMTPADQTQAAMETLPDNVRTQQGVTYYGNTQPAHLATSATDL